MLKVKQIFDDSEHRYGADKIRAVLAENGLRISTKRVLPIMQELGLHSIRTDAKKVYKNQMREKQNLLHRKFTRITQIKYGWAILLTSKSKMHGSISALLSTSSPAMS